MKKKAFIKIGDTRISLGNIKSFGISKETEIKYPPIGEFRRKIWISDYTIKKTYRPDTWKTIANLHEGDFEEYERYNDNQWKKFVNMEMLKIEYDKIKSIAVQKGEREKRNNKEKNLFTGFFKNIFGDFGKIDMVLSEQEAIIPFTEKGQIIPSWGDPIALTQGQLFYNGDIFRCAGSPYECARVVKHIKERADVLGGDYEIMQQEKCSQDRKYDKEANLINSGELKKIQFDVTMTKEEIISRYLYIKTFQDDNFKFSENTYDIDNVLKKLDKYLSV